MENCSKASCEFSEIQALQRFTCSPHVPGQCQWNTGQCISQKSKVFSDIPIQFPCLLVKASILPIMISVFQMVSSRLIDGQSSFFHAYDHIETSNLFIVKSSCLFGSIPWLYRLYVPWILLMDISPTSWDWPPLSNYGYTTAISKSCTRVTG